MQHDITIAITAGLGGMFGWGLADLFAKKTIDTIGDIASLFWAHIFGSIAFLVFFLIELSRGAVFMPLSSVSTWVLLAFFGVLQALVYLLLYRGFSKGQVSILNPMFASFSGLVALFSIAFLGEHFTGSILVGLVIIFTGIVLLNIDISALRAKKLSFSKTPGFNEIALGTICAAAWTLLWNLFVAGKSAIISAFLMYVFMTLAIFIYAKAQKLTLKFKAPSVWKFLILIGICEAVAFYAITLGYEMSDHTSIIALVSGAFSLPTIVFARVYLKEHITRLQTFAVLGIIIGIICISLTS